MTGKLVTDDVELAARRLIDGGLVAIPTETVYGLAADAERPEAVKRVFAVKGRPAGHPLIVHVADRDAIEGWVGEVDDTTGQAIDRLAESAWPGPLTMLVPRGRRVVDAVTGGRPSVGLRVPAHPMTTALLGLVGGGLAAPSANRFGRVSPTTAEHVLHDLGDVLVPGRDVILDGGPCPVGVESTIVDLTVAPPQIVRAGAIDADAVERIVAMPVAGAAGPSRASGMLAAHYAPDCEVVLAADAEDAAQIAARLGALGRLVEVIDRTDDLVLAARSLYADLRAADERHLDAVVVVLPPPRGLGHALRDRLEKAAAGSRRSGGG
jgi:L-threonylcarbamoyladenylate synthase